MTRRIGLVTYDPSSRDVHSDPEIDQLVQALRHDGLDAEAVVWSTENDWTAYDMLILKSPWDYSMRAEEFVAWLDATAAHVPILNHPWIIRWNIDKRYLWDLQAEGVRTPAFVTPASMDEAQQVLRGIDSHRVVVKPTVSAGSRNTGLFNREDPAALRLVGHILRQGKVPMVMPALPDVAQNGERSLVVFDGRYSHAAHKATILAEGGGYVGGEYAEVITAATPLDDEIDVAERCIQVVRQRAASAGLSRASAAPLYARVDIARDADGQPSVLELELFEPNYFTATVPSAVANFVSAVERALGRLG
ncbi:ATP-grasp domain-containing protein [Tessaracoccus defluvii]|uniref:ATP-grasp domain-containing protein n=1 Tax=Tessaracoccus defluvii TaxID=1285901 RepID=A0A7H0H2K5_9ACTN|nr:hypothetical protein [Tessaracoccus defluvii]QNP54771.1 hypothetical protein H9L22_10705 [Tessaracoccus defluvii]